ncbi:hypothetical protein Acr_14g0005050 [Actinidia rufa]|uniref:Uncharacterized protein n=1 Tax=Actinidia rufa TaxID=165716 RepID=A0A7J0FRS3_9ERIC|nr:hypothetical protein Acr_14g0005050 [Actinidia rufa]
MEGWLACMAKLGILKDNPAWAKATFVTEFLESPKPYSLLILPSFNEEEYMNEPTKEVGKEAQVNEAAELVGEVAAEEVGKAAAQDLPNEL